MCTGIEIAAAASAIIGAGAAIHQGQVQSNYADYQRDQALADAQAASDAAKVEANRIRLQSKQQRSQAIAALAGSGVDVNSSTALEIDRTIGKNVNLDAFQTIAAGNDKALRLNADAQGYGLQAGQASTAGMIGATNSLLGGAYTVAKGWKGGKA